MSPPVPPNPFAPRTYGQLVQVTPRVYLFRNIVNSTIVIGDRGVAIIDTQVNLPMARRLLAATRSLTQKPILYAINTHYHWDHTNGNSAFREAGATLVARRDTVDFMTSRSSRQKAFLASRAFPLGEDPVLADLVIDGDTELDLGGQPLRLLYLGAAETTDATAVHLPAEGSAVSGDAVMTGSFPIFGQPVMNEGLMQPYSWIETVRRVQALKPREVLPGHGPLARQAEIDLLLRIENFFIEEVGRRVSLGMELPEVLSDLEPRLPEWITRIPEVWGTPRYAILRVYRGLVDDAEPGWQHFKPSAVPAAPPETLRDKSEALRGVLDFVQAAEEAEEGGDPGLAIGLLREAVRRFTADARAHVALADTLMRVSRVVASVLEKGDFFHEAQEAARQALELDSAFGPAHLFQGQFQVMMAYRNGDDPAPGVASIRKAIECGLDIRGQAQAHFFLGMAERTLGREREAKAFFHQALSLDARYAQAALALRA
ncbi:MAG: MBL fold metallo-hydrolase [Planctomycetes bacterium]|nr:MBL fold metallo-hydrolase [Planctomycetota bacterium]